MLVQLHIESDDPRSSKVHDFYKNLGVATHKNVSSQFGHGKVDTSSMNYRGASSMQSPLPQRSTKFSKQSEYSDGQTLRT